MSYLAFDDFFAVLANQNRVRVLQYLNNVGPKNVTDMANKLNVEQSQLSHCLKRLLDCHFVNVQNVGKQRVYSINTDTVRPLIALIEKHVKLNCAKGCQHWG